MNMICFQFCQHFLATGSNINIVNKAISYNFSNNRYSLDILKSFSQEPLCRSLRNTYIYDLILLLSAMNFTTFCVLGFLNNAKKCLNYFNENFLELL